MTLAIVGRTGAGKTFAAKTMVERELAENRKVCIVDPTGAWWGLRLDDTGAFSLYDVVIFGGEHADVHIRPEDGELIADAIVDDRAHQSVIDVSEMSNAEQKRLLTDFFERIYTRNRSPLRLVLDEADMMAPQNPMPEARRLKGVVDKIVRRGRIKGFRPMLITQRPQVIDKSVLSQIETLVAMKLTSPQDRKAIEEWVKGNADAAQAKQVLDSLAKLDRGEGWIWSPSEDRLERVKFPPIQSFDSSRTPDDERPAADVRPLGRFDLAALREIFATSDETEKISTGTPVERAPDLEQIAEAEERGFQRGYGEGVAAGRSHAAGLIWSDLEVFFGTVRRLFDKIYPNSAADTRPVEFILTPPAKPAAKTTPKPKASAAADGMNSAARKMLSVLDTNPPVKRSWTQIATLAGLKARGGHFNAGRKQLLEQRLVDEEHSLVRIVSPSAAAAPANADPAALVEMWAGALSGAAPKILRTLFGLGGSASRSAIAQRLGMQPRGGHWNAAWKELRENEIVAIDGDTTRLTELFYPNSSREEQA